MNEPFATASLYKDFEDDRAHREGPKQEQQLHQVTARIDSTAHEVLLNLADRWNISKSALVADILEASLQDFAAKLQRDAEKAAL